MSQPTTITDAATIAEALSELAAYDDEEHRAWLAFVRAVLEQEAGAGEVVD